VIRADAVSKAYRDATALDGVCLDLPAGGLTALVGPNGAGKSTLLGVIGRLTRADFGLVEVGGMNVVAARSRDLARRLAVLRQDNHLATRLTVAQLVELGRFPHCGGRLGPADRAAIERAVAATGVGPLAHRFLDELSGGQRQRAHIAMLFAQDAEYVLLDEPLAALDLRHATELMALLRAACDQDGKTVVVVVHDVNYASAWADRIVALKDGRVVATGPPAELVQSDFLSALYGTPVRVVDTGGWPLAVYHR
jgi:iron complex transport system ATP-binding protein